jgi:LacI family transcriptional regulator
MAAAAVGVAHRRGLHVPQDISIVGFDDTSLATTIWPELTTVRQPRAALAEAALNLWLARGRARRGAGGEQLEEQVLDHELIARESSGPPPAKPGVAKAGGPR